MIQQQRRRKWAISAIAAALLAAAGCAGVTGSGSIFQAALGIVDANSLTITLVARQRETVQVEVVADGRQVDLPECGEIPGVACQFVLTTCPDTLTPLSALRFDTAGELVSGLDFAGLEGFDLARGVDYECGDTIFFDFTRSQVNVFIPGR